MSWCASVPFQHFDEHHGLTRWSCKSFEKWWTRAWRNITKQQREARQRDGKGRTKGKAKGDGIGWWGYGNSFWVSSDKKISRLKALGSNMFYNSCFVASWRWPLSPALQDVKYQADVWSGISFFFCIIWMLHAIASLETLNLEVSKSHRFFSSFEIWFTCWPHTSSLLFTQAQM